MTRNAFSHSNGREENTIVVPWMGIMSSGVVPNMKLLNIQVIANWSATKQIGDLARNVVQRKLVYFHIAH